jgi:long-chain acyl-CoA synthetase
MRDEADVTAAGRAVAWLARQFEVELAEAGLSLPQYRLLSYLSTGSAGPSPAARELSTSRPSVTSLVDGLVAKGLVDRHAHVDDRRRVTLVLTAEGQRTLAGADAVIAGRLSELADYLEPDQAARAYEGLLLWGTAQAARGAAKADAANATANATAKAPA